LQTFPVNDILFCYEKVFLRIRFPMENQLILADTHIHFYNCFDVGYLLDSAFKNFQKEADRSIGGTNFKAFLFLAETKTESWFQHQYDQVLREPSRAGRVGQWTVQFTNEDCSLYVRSNDRKGLYIIAGRQVKTMEKLEVLALGTIHNFQDGTPLEELIREINRLGALAVIPWGVGKWIGRRGGIVKNLLKKGPLPSFFLGDNGNRPIFWPKSNLFKQAEQKGLSVLRGGDPLPFPSEIGQIGRFGIRLQGSIDPGYPYRDIKKILLDPATHPQMYGSLERPGRFFGNQLRFFFKKRAETTH
jgi:hypothetical protein